MTTSGAGRADGFCVSDVEWLSTTEVARRLDLSLRTVYGFIDRGELVAYRMGRVIRVREPDLAEFIERCRIRPGELGL